MDIDTKHVSESGNEEGPYSSQAPSLSSSETSSPIHSNDFKNQNESISMNHDDSSYNSSVLTDSGAQMYSTSSSATSYDPPSYSNHETVSDSSTMELDTPNEQSNASQNQQEPESNTTVSNPAQDSKQRNLEESRKKLQSVDAILESEVFIHLKKFLLSGGSPQDVIKALSGAYRGYPQMCNLLSYWLRLTGMSDSEIITIFQEEIRKSIVEKFDPQKADTIFEGGSAPIWLGEMIKESYWRHMIYELSETNRDCLLLNFGIQQISSAGHDDEIASLPSAATYFSVFNRVLTNTLQKVIRKSETELFSALSDFSRLTGHSEHTFLYTQAILHVLSQFDKSSKIKRIIQELDCTTRNAAYKTWNTLQISSKTQILDSETENIIVLSTPNNDANNSSSRSDTLNSISDANNVLLAGSVADRIPYYHAFMMQMTNIHFYPSLATGFQAVMNSELLSPGDVRKIHLAYTSCGTPSTDSDQSSGASINYGLPPANFLRNPEFLDKIIKALIDPQNDIPSDFISSYYWVLAYASCSTDNRPIFATHSPTPSSMSYASTAPLLKEIMDSLQIVRLVCSRIVIGTPLQDAVEKIMSHIHYPIVAMLVLCWIKWNISDPEKLGSMWNTRSLQTHLLIMREIVATHPLQQAKALQILSAAFSAEPPVDPLTALNVKKCILETISYLVECGYVIPVLQQLEDWAPNMDQSLIRHFLIHVLEMAGPPFSLAFLEPILRLLSRVKIDLQEHKSIVQPFIDHVSKAHHHEFTSHTVDIIEKIKNTLLS